MPEDLDEAFDRLERMTIRVNSSDGSVTASYNLVQGVSLTIKSRDHSEDSLQEQVRQAITAVNQGCGKGTGKALAASPVTDEPGPQLRRRRRKYGAAVAALEADATSPRRLVKMRLTGDGGLDVRYRPGTLSRMDVTLETLSAETVATLNTALDILDEQRRALARQILETPLTR